MHNFKRTISEIVIMESTNIIESIIREKYGELGAQVYDLIDGQRNAEEIMQATSVPEKKLAEMLEFMEQKGIIKMRYPDQKTTQQQTQFTVSLPVELRKRMYGHEINWNGTIPKLISLYLDSVEKAETHGKIMKFFKLNKRTGAGKAGNGSTKKSKKQKQAVTKRKRLKTAKAKKNSKKVAGRKKSKSR